VSAKSEYERPPPSQRLERSAQYKQLTVDSGAVMCRCTVATCGKEFRHKTHLARHMAVAHGLVVRSTSPKPIMKTRAAFCLITTPLTRMSRILCKDLLKPRHASRNPMKAINAGLIKQECLLRLPRAAAGTIKVSKKTKARAATLIAKMPDDAMSLLSSAGSPTLREVMTAPREMIAKKRPHEMVDESEAKRPSSGGAPGGVIRHGADSASSPVPPPLTSVSAANPVGDSSTDDVMQVTEKDKEVNTVEMTE